MQDGSRLGQKRLTAIDTALTDDLYEKLLILKTTDADGNTVERERRTTVNHAMKSCRRAWNVAGRRNPEDRKMVCRTRFSTSAFGRRASPVVPIRKTLAAEVFSKHHSSGDLRARGRMV